MKKLFFLVFQLFLLVIVANAHDMEKNGREIHQKIVVEAYKLLKIQLSKESNGFVDFDNYIGEEKNYHIDYWHNNWNVAAGSEDEDDQDIVYNISFPTPTMTHFWNPDHPYNKVNLLLLSAVSSKFLGEYPSAYEKACRYINDNYEKEITKPHAWGATMGYKSITTSIEANSALYKLYYKNSIHVKVSGDYYELAWFSLIEELGGPWDARYDYDLSWDTKQMFFNILGRICHLLSDMSVPEHIGSSMHGIIENAAPFEDWLKNNKNQFYWTADMVYKYRGGFVNPFCSIQVGEETYDPNLFLFYTVGQLADWFRKVGCQPASGDDDYNTDIGEINSIINTYGSSVSPYLRVDPFYGFPKFPPYSIYMNNELGAMYRDILLPYTIRAVAGMMYRFIIESKMQFPYATSNEKGSIFDQQQELDLFNQEINGDYYTFNAEGNPGRITVCSTNRPTGYNKDFKIGSLARNVTFRAAKEIVFKDGFVAESGSSMRAYINTLCQECPTEDFHPVYNAR